MSHTKNANPMAIEQKTENKGQHIIWSKCRIKSVEIGKNYVANVTEMSDIYLESYSTIAQRESIIQLHEIIKINVNQQVKSVIIYLDEIMNITPIINFIDMKFYVTQASETKPKDKSHIQRGYFSFYHIMFCVFFLLCEKL